ncbi:MAG: hypothetical protein DME12_04940 [Candidatus Rokuibacteriota bacterium]|nr:MAG: hypothetical protein DME12_04940 [Candidatus Rokubacteria bacterium]PYM66854.1 MAG: hypothetical protein DME11_05490 [Candidatus Rokubacteria bacterium]
MVQQDERTQQALSYIRHQASQSLAELRAVLIELADPSTTIFTGQTVTLTVPARRNESRGRGRN